MITIQTSKLKRLSKVFATADTNSNPAFKYVYLDFAEKKIKFMNGVFYLSANIDISNPENENHENMFVDGTKLFYIVDNYDSFEVDGDIFKSGRTKFTLPKGDAEAVEFPDIDESYFDKCVEINYDSSFKKVLDNCSEYVDKDDTQFSSLFFRNNHALIINPKKMLISKLPCELNGNEFDIPFKFLKSINILAQEGNSFRIRYSANDNETTSMMYEDSYIKIRFATSSKYAMPNGLDPFSEKFRNSFHHPNNIIISQSELKKVLDLRNFFKDMQKPLLIFSFSGDNLVISVGNAGEAECNIPISSISDSEYFKDVEFTIYADYLASAVKVLSKDNGNIMIMYSKDRPSVCITNAVDEDVIAIHTLVKDI